MGTVTGRARARKGVGGSPAAWLGSPGPVVWGVLLVAVLSACATGGEPRTTKPERVPALGVQPARVAILVPYTTDRMLATAYAKLESRTANLFQTVLGSQVAERTDLPSVQAEQHWQYAQPAAEDSLVSLGRLVGADALVLYRIVTPDLAERMFAESGAALSPVSVLAKVVGVETGLVLWTYEVTVPTRSAGHHIAREGGV
ncbi:hypothetical protein [Nitrospira sp. Kam-Ns4a]